MLFTSTLFQIYVKKSDRLYMKQRQLSVFSAIIFPLKCTFFILIGFLIYPYISSFTVFLFSLYSSFLLFCRITFRSSPIKYVSPTIVCQQRVSFTHVMLYHMAHNTNNRTLHLYRTKDSAKLSVDNPQSCLLWKAASCLNSHRCLKKVLPRP